NVEHEFPEWKDRIESQYVPLKLFENIETPITPRPYYGEGKFYTEAAYGNEWLINNYYLYYQGITLYGKDFEELVNQVDIEAVKKACIKDLQEEWKPQIEDPTYLDNPHYQSYVILNICRILYTVFNNDLSSKTASSNWVKQQYPKWSKMINSAQQWSYGKEMNYKQDTKEFIRFALTVTQADS
ncbi:DUF4111 domain-containing protein, partial [Candidatus Dojkabacteria bacterium]|nr:DUF4111 domain-containing protein [Candidatus Dojkabacteria bacterium]